MKCGQGVMAGLAKCSNDRPETCAAVLTGGTRFVASDMGGTRSVASDRGKAAAPRQPRRPVLLPATLLLLLGLGIGGFFWHQHNVAAARRAEQARRFEQQKKTAEIETREKAKAEREAALKAKADAEARERVQTEKESERAAERIVYELSSKADGAHEAMNREDDDFKSFFADEIRTFEDERRAGDDAKKNARYVIATNLLTKALSTAVALRTADEQRKRCTTALAAVERARTSAVAVGAEDAAKVQFEKASSIVRAAKDSLGNKKYADTLASARNAVHCFGEIRTGIISNALARARSHKSAEHWEDCLASAEKVLNWESGNAEAKALRDEANGHLVPSLRLVTRIDTRVVEGAETRIGEQTYRSPMKWERLKDGSNIGGYRFEYSEHGRKYAGTAPQWTVDWRGLKTMIVTLQEYKPSPGDTMTITLLGGAKLELVYCPPGSFTMGSPSNEEGRYDDETQHRVTLTKGFWIGKYEVTQKQWQSVMGSNPSRFKGENRPVEQVSWEDCQQFCRKAGLDLRLPTEAEWEYACRAGTTTPYSFGRVLNGDRANCNSNYPYGTTAKGRYRQETSVVGEYRPNAWGLYDMHGNVCEWCSDWYGKYEGAAADPTGPASDVTRVNRGGGWNALARLCRSAFRNHYIPGNRDDFLGFRVCCSAGPYEYE